MKPRLAFSGLLLAFTSLLSGQEEEAREVRVEGGGSAVVAPPPRSAAELEKLLGPIALYPDPLIALMLPAATTPSDIVLAARFLAANPGTTAFEEQSWDDSVKGLAHYPDVLKWMDQNLEWTKQLGEAFAHQPTDVMSAVQQLRAMAKSVGSLASTPQQTVVTEGEDIQIVPASTEVIYVPRYDPAVVYVESPYYYYPRPALTFGFGYAIGHWMAYDCDWRRRSVWYVSSDCRPQVWRERCTVGFAVYASRPHRHSEPYWRAWRPSNSVRIAGGHNRGDRASFGYAARNDGSSRSRSYSEPSAVDGNRHSVTRWNSGESRPSARTNATSAFAYSNPRSGNGPRGARSDDSPTVQPHSPAQPRSAVVPSTPPAVRDSDRSDRFVGPSADRSWNRAPRVSGGSGERSRENRVPAPAVSTPPAQPRSYSPPQSRTENSAPRSYSQPRSDTTSSRSVGQSRGDSSGSRSYSQPRSDGQSTRSYSQPRSESPAARSYSAPESNSGGGRSYSAPRNDTAARAAQQSAPQSSSSQSRSASWQGRTSEGRGR